MALQIGGYGIIMEWVNKKYIKEFSEGYQMTTNNRMELFAIIIALESLKIEPMEVIWFFRLKICCGICR